jgi:uncharacterized protein (TIGR00255 family)
MINSMTAFARESSGGEQDALVVELRSVNHRYLDFHFKLPEELRALEPALRERLGRRLRRGKVDCMLRLGAGAAGGAALELDRARLQQVLAACGDIAQAAGTLAPPDPLAILQFPGVVRSSGTSEADLARRALATFEAALDALAGTRAREGKQLRALVTARLDAVADEVAALRARLPALRTQQRERLRQRVADLGAEADPQRLEQELVLLAQKSDVDEELDRLETHAREVRRVLGEGGPCGRRLDFLMQELNREANTLSAKASASSQTQGAIELKVLIEQMREQVQNIE